MCGICGIAGRARPEIRNGAGRMCDRLGHRGPDSSGLEERDLSAGRALMLGHRRLSILDLSDAGRQPMADPENGNRIVFNGEIYNYRAIRDRLLREGVSFSSHTDTEVILKGYDRLGMGILAELEGMFAFALYDARQGRLVLVRDPLGIKPLYYAWSGEGDFLFSSEIRALAASGVMPVELDRSAVASCLAYGSVQEPATVLKGVRLLKAGEWMSVDLRDPRCRVIDYDRYWTIPEAGSFRGTRRDALAELRGCVDRAVAGHLVSDVPVGLFLSAGVDSSAIASVCRRLNRSVHTWTFSLQGEGGKDEIGVARQVAERFGLSHEEVTLPTDAIAQDFTRFADGLDQPTVDGFNTWLMARACRQHGSKVALSGLGGDELFGGYIGLHRMPSLYRLNRGLRVLPGSIRRALLRLSGTGMTPCQREKLSDLLEPSWTYNELTLSRRRLFGRTSLDRLGFGDVRWLLNPIDMPLETDLYTGSNPALRIATAGVLDARFYMRNTLLRDADVCGMAHGVEIRVPWLDRRLAELAFSLPGDWRQPANGVNKPLLVEAADVPECVIKRRKTGFNLPYARWLKKELRGLQEESRDRLLRRNELAPAGIHAVFRDFESHPGGPEWSRIWMLMVWSRWREAFARAAERPA